MANKQQISFLLAFLAAAMILLAGQATAADQSAPSKPDVEKTLDAFLKGMIAEIQRARAKVAVLGNSEMVRDCEKAFGTSFYFLNKAIELNEAPEGGNGEEIDKNVQEAVKAYASCDQSRLIN